MKRFRVRPRTLAVAGLAVATCATGQVITSALASAQPSVDRSATSQDATLSSKPVANIHATPAQTTTCANSAVVFTATGTRPIRGVTWSWLDGSTTHTARGTRTRPLYFTTPGRPTVTAAIRFVDGATRTKTLRLPVAACGSVLTISAPKPDTCAGDTVRAAVSAPDTTNPVSSVAWTVSPAGTQVASDTTSTTRQFDTAGTYVFDAKVTLQNGTTITPQPKRVVISNCASNPTITSSKPLTDTCSDSSVAFSLTGEHPVVSRVDWTADGAAINPQAAQFAAGGTASIKAAITYRSGATATATLSYRVYWCLQLTESASGTSETLSDGFVDTGDGTVSCDSCGPIHPDSDGNATAILYTYPAVGSHLYTCGPGVETNYNMCVVTLTQAQPTVVVRPVWHPNAALTATSPTFNHSGSGVSPAPPGDKLYFSDSWTPPSSYHTNTASAKYTCTVWEVGNPSNHDPVYGACTDLGVAPGSFITVYGWVHVYDGLFSAHSGAASVTITYQYIPDYQAPGTN
jgi:hypothetical protein